LLFLLHNVVLETAVVGSLLLLLVVETRKASVDDGSIVVVITRRKIGCVPAHSIVRVCSNSTKILLMAGWLAVWAVSLLNYIDTL
jgi:hypothetical protein